MENFKHTKEYAEKLAKENVVYGESVANYVFGYMKSIEETAAPDLLEFINRMISEDNFINQHDKEDAINLIKKATQIEVK